MKERTRTPEQSVTITTDDGDYVLLLDEAREMADEEGITTDYILELDAINQLRIAVEAICEQPVEYVTSTQ